MSQEAKNLRTLLGVAVVAFGLLWSTSGCTNGGGVNMRELAFATRVALVISAEEEPTAEEIQSLLDSALAIAADRGLNEEELEAARMVALTAMVVYTSNGDWRVALAELLEAIESGEPE